MKQPKQIVLCSVLLMFTFCNLSAQSNYEVELAAFNTPVSMTYFEGISGIEYHKDQYDIHRYRIKHLKSEKEPEQKRQLAVSKGFNARVINMADVPICGTECSDQLDHLFFDFDQSRLTYNSKSKLQDLAATLKSNPNFQAVLAGHTDAKGDNEYNETLSNLRVQEAMDYLLSMNVKSDQIKTAFFGENAPIAKNTLNGDVDLPSGRKFNRRVEVSLVDTAKKRSLEGFVRKIAVPSELKY